jgi:hypothetical protein
MQTLRTKGGRSVRAARALYERTEQERNERNQVPQTCTGMRLKPRFWLRTTRARRVHGPRAAVHHARRPLTRAALPAAAGRPYADADGGVGHGAETASGTDAPWYPRTRGGPEGLSVPASSREVPSSEDELSARAESASGRAAAGRRV